MVAMELEHYFGQADARNNSSADIIADHLTRKYESILKKGTRDAGKSVIVGIKGSGKTALRRHIEQEKEAIVWNLDVDHGFMKLDVGDLNYKSGILKSSVALK